MSLLRPRTRIGRLLVGLTAVLAVGLVSVVILRPWAVAATLEGPPSATWPGGGRFVHHLEQKPLPPGSSDNGVDSTEAFDQQFFESEGSAVVVASGPESGIVFSRFAEGYSPETEFNSFSMAKSLVGVLTLKAISDGRIDGLDATVAELWSDADRSEMASVTVGELMDMRSGLSFEKPPGRTGDAETDKKNSALQVSPTGNLARLHVDGLEAVISDVHLIEADRWPLLLPERQHRHPGSHSGGGLWRDDRCLADRVPGRSGRGRALPLAAIPIGRPNQPVLLPLRSGRLVDPGGPLHHEQRSAGRATAVGPLVRLPDGNRSDG